MLCFKVKTAIFQGTYSVLGRNGSVLLRKWQRLDRLDHQIAWKVTANQANHLVIVESRDNMVVRCAVENLPYLLQKAFSVELCGADKGILSQKNVLASKRRVETVVKTMG